jgi:hypothetical protein
VRKRKSKGRNEREVKREKRCMQKEGSVRQSEDRKHEERRGFSG